MSANVLGLGYDNCVKVATDDDGLMKMDALEECIQAAKDAGKTPFCVIATSGTTVRGCFDPLRPISAICKANNIWMHVDAAWGGAVLMSAKHRYLMDGSELCDSMCWDTHKMMGIPMICSAFLIQRLDVLKTVCSHGQSAHYLLHKDMEDLDMGHRSLQCGRRNDALKLWLAWRDKGDDGWEKLIDSFMDRADYLESLVVAHPRMEMMSSRKFGNVCCRYNPEPGNSSPNGINLNELTNLIRLRLYETGRFMISKALIRDDVVLRPVTGTLAATNETYKQLFDTIVEIGDKCIAEMK